MWGGRCGSSLSRQTRENHGALCAVALATSLPGRPEAWVSPAVSPPGTAPPCLSGFEAESAKELSRAPRGGVTHADGRVRCCQPSAPPESAGWGSEGKPRSKARLAVASRPAGHGPAGWTSGNLSFGRETCRKELPRAPLQTPTSYSCSPRPPCTPGRGPSTGFSLRICLGGRAHLVPSWGHQLGALP